MAADQEKLKEAFDSQQLLTREMAHRLKNVLAVVQGLMNMASRRSTSAADLVAKMSTALQALSAAQTVVTSRSGEAGTIVSAELGDVLQLVLAPYKHASITLNGPDVNVGSQAANVLALVFHELATNAAKYGALSSPEGTINVQWKSADGQVSIQWVERNGPPVTGVPSTAGFGTLLATKSIDALRGTISPDWLARGLSVQITVPAARLLQ